MEFRSAFEISPVPEPTVDAVGPGHFDGIYGMPAFVTVTTDDIDRSVRFWTEALDFFVLFAVPGRLVHLRRWAFQDVLLVPGAPQADGGTTTVSFACVLGELPAFLERLALFPDAEVHGPTDTPWNTLDVEVVTPEHVRVVVTAAKPYDASSAEARALRDVGIAPTPADADAEQDGPRDSVR
ncbi:VOC family protein [Curtobacterium sp. NPDC089689]|uniref:VOC family protein n=1 Tax=Curtobacterium sp. NPDC089689 TaxID=3363968 RepID=UPI0038084F3F